MLATTTIAPSIATLKDLVARLGGIPLERIRFHPLPGTATEADVLARPDGVKRLCELVDGVLVEKPMGYYESRMAIVLAHLLEAFLEEHPLGIVLGADATLRLFPGVVRLPDVCFISWARFPDRRLPLEPVPDLVPDLAVEILSEGNTRAEMERKRREYFAAGTRLVWEVDPPARTVTVYTAPERAATLTEAQAVDGGDVLPGFSLAIHDWFERAGRQASQRA